MSVSELETRTLIVPLPPEAPVREEHLHVAPENQDGAQLWRVTAVPFVSYDLAVGDLVSAKAETGDSLHLDEVVARSGHLVARVLFAESADLMSRMKTLLRLKELRVSAGDPRGRYYALDIPADADLDALAAHLEEQADDGLIEFEMFAPGLEESD